jgi:hypothetical protein
LVLALSEATGLDRLEELIYDLAGIRLLGHEFDILVHMGISAACLAAL